MKSPNKKLGAFYGVGAEDLALVHYCPACEQLHKIDIGWSNHLGVKWEHDGDYETPTITPSINIDGVCQYSITSGKILYSEYSKHSLAGQTMDLPDLPSWLTYF